MTGELEQKRREADTLPDEPDSAKGHLRVDGEAPTREGHPSVPAESEYQTFENVTSRLLRVAESEVESCRGDEAAHRADPENDATA